MADTPTVRPRSGETPTQQVFTAPTTAQVNTMAAYLGLARNAVNKGITKGSQYRAAAYLGVSMRDMTRAMARAVYVFT